MTYKYVITMVSDINEAKLIAKNLVTKHLASCVNIVPSVTSIYEWKGEVCSESELMVFAKTRSELFEEVKKEILSHHSYDLPAVVSIPVEDGHKPFLQWVDEQCKK